MKIRMLRQVNALKPGTVLEQTDGVANLWILQNKAELYTELQDDGNTGKPRNGPKRRASHGNRAANAPPHHDK